MLLLIQDEITKDTRYPRETVVVVVEHLEMRCDIGDCNTLLVHDKTMYFGGSVGSTPFVSNRRKEERATSERDLHRNPPLGSRSLTAHAIFLLEIGAGKALLLHPCLVPSLASK